MTQGSTSVFPFLLVLMGYAMAGIHLWPSLHIALSNASVFVDYSTDCNGTDHGLTISLVDIENNVTVLNRPIPANQSEGKLEFNCSCFLYAGSFRFRLEQANSGVSNSTATWWWSPVLRIQWPTFHIAVERAGNNRSSGSFQVSVSTNDHFHACPGGRASALYLEVSYLEYNQIGRNSIDKVRARRRHDIEAVKQQRVALDCAFPFTERDFVRVALRSLHTPQDVKTSGPLYLSRIFTYKLQVDNVYKSGCEGTVAVRLVPPPCAFTSGKVLLYREGGRGGVAAATGGAEEATSPLAFNWLTQGENETEFNCSVFDPGRNKYCFRFVLNFSRSPSPAQTCVIVQRNAETWGPWQSWSGCSVTCGEGVRERVRDCLVPSGGGMPCTGMVREQSHCSLEDCAVALPPPSLTPPPAVASPLGGNLVAVAGISLCLAVILATVLVTVWRKACRAPKCSSVRRGSMHSPGGRKNSDEASICGHSLQRPSFCDSLQAAPPPQKGLSLPPPAAGPPPDRDVLARQQSQTLPLPLPLPHTDPERMSPSGQKIVPPIFGYRLAQQQLKEMKKKGLKETTQVYHVSQSPIDDTMLESSTATPAGLSAAPQDTDSQEDASASRFRIKAPFPPEAAWAPKASATLPDRLGPRVDLPAPPGGFGSSSRRHERTADWVEMVEWSGAGYTKNPNFRRTSSFHESKQQHAVAPVGARPFRERSLTQVAPRQLPEGSCRTRAWEQPHPIPELDDWARPKSRMMDSSAVDNRRRPWVETPLRRSDSKPGVAAAEAPGETELASDRHGGAGARGTSLGLDRAERAGQNWSRRGPSPIQRNILARKLREANASSSTCQRQRSSTFSTSAEQRRDRCRSLPLSADYAGGSSPYGLTETEQRMMDLSGYLGEDDGVEGLRAHRLT